MPFIQEPPRLGNQYRDDRVLRHFLLRTLPRNVLREIEPTLDRMGELSAGRLYEMSLRCRKDEPELVQWDPWGRRIDEIRVPEAWKELGRVAAEEGLVGTAYERQHGAHSRVHHFALVYLFAPSSHVYTCPLAMTDGAARTLDLHGSAELRERVVPRLVSRDPERAWTSGQWMTERTGGSDVGLSETIAREAEGGWRLSGTKWFTSATTSEVALTLARPEGNPPGGRGLALFLVERMLPDGTRNAIRVNRLKEKLGTRMVPTAELELDGALATLVSGRSDGIKKISPMLNITRTWNSVCSVAGMRRGVALARDYAARREAFGASLAQKPLHLDTLASMQAETEGAFQLTFRMVELLGRQESGELQDSEAAALRLFFPLTKLLTAKQAVAGASETLEAFGGAGYVEDTGLPVLLRDAQVLPIWEGTTNVLSLDALRAIAREDALGAFLEELRGCVSGVKHGRLVAAGKAALSAAANAEEWLGAAAKMGQPAVEAGARRFAMTLGRAMQLALLCRQAQWDLEELGDNRSATAARRFAAMGVDLLLPPEEGLEEIRALGIGSDWLT